MKRTILLMIISGVVVLLLPSNTKKETPTHSLRVVVTGLRNSIGNVQFSLYNKEGSIPDEKYRKYYLQKTVEIKNGQAQVRFIDMPEGRYAINILHDENKDGKIEKGWIMPIEGVGFSNFVEIGISNRPSFKKASFLLKKDTYKKVKIIYM